MKKWMLIPAVILIVAATALAIWKPWEKANTTDLPLVQTQYSFEATVIEISGDLITVEPAEGMQERSSSDRITFSAAELEDIGVTVGAKVEVIYDGLIRETYPASITAQSWKLLTTDACVSEDDPSGFTYAKPVIYLYPEEKTAVSVFLETDDGLTCAYPAYNDGWQVTASPDGTLTDANGQTYNYLYWEGNACAEFDFSKGFCVKGADTAAFLEEVLPQLGLNRREANEFIVYWLPLMEGNRYNIISFQEQAYTESARLQITPKPDTLIRVFMAWRPADDYQQLEPQELDAPDRSGFTVIEWGGAEITMTS